MNYSWFASLKSIPLAVVAALVVVAWSAQAEEPDDVYLRIVAQIRQADTLAANGQVEKALPKYKDALNALEKFKLTYPDSNAKAVVYRLNYASERVASLSQQAKAAAGDSEVKLLEAGAEPRAVLRLHPKPDDKQSMTLALKMNMNMKMGEMPEQSTKLPSMTMTMDITTKKVADNGDITYEMVMGDPTVADDPDAMPVVVEAMKSALGKMKGLSGTTTVSSRGLIKSTEMNGPADTDPQTRQVMDQMKDTFSHLAAQLPEEAVGVGAKWTVKMPVKSQGMSMTQTTTYELASMEGDNLQTKLAIAQTAANQKIQSPTMPGLNVDLTKMSGKGSGDMNLDLSRLAASQVTIDLHTDTTMGMDLAGQKQTINTVLDLNMRMESK